MVNVDVASETIDSAEETKIIKVYVAFLLMFQTIFRLSDHAMDILFAFFSSFLNIVGKRLHIQAIQHQNIKLPTTIQQARVYSGGRNSFRQYCCCVKCNSIYHKEECIKTDSKGACSSALCSYIRFPNHPHRARQKACNTPLMKSIRLPSGKTSLRPHLTYCFSGIIASLQRLLLRPGFIELCESWRSNVADSGWYNDVYDGKMWNDFQHVDGRPFLSLPYNFALQMNVDWFQPYDHITHSEGVIFVSVLNLPRTVRYIQDNTILLGVIPGPKEPKLHINSFLAPFVSELKDLWTGVILKTAHGTQQFVRAALLAVSCDIPAGRKVCGFTGPNSYCGCSRCLVKFPTNSFGEKPDYSNFDIQSWTLRDKDSHLRLCQEYLNCRSRKEQKNIEHKHGIRYSCLVELSYFNPSRMCIVDPMHNLLLGTAKKNDGNLEDS